MERLYGRGCGETGLVSRGSAGSGQEAKVAYGGIQEQPEIRTDASFRLRQEGGGVVPDGTLDRWLGCSLHEAFDAVIAEPLPGELLRLIGEAPRGQRES